MSIHCIFNKSKLEILLAGTFSAALYAHKVNS